MRIFLYSIQTALKSVWHEKWIYILTILSISISLMILSSFITITYNVDSILKRWSKSFGLVVYLNTTLNREAERTLKEFFSKDPDIVDVTYISKDKAFQELKNILGEDAPVLEDMKDNPLPSSLELKLRRELITPDSVKLKAEQIEKISGVDDVQYGEKWLSSLNSVSQIMKITTTFLGIAILIAIIFITYNTIKVFFYRRKDEIETLKLLGATRIFIRLPFLIEGLFIGVVGGIIASFTLLAIQSMMMVKEAQFLYTVRSIMVTLPFQIYVLITLIGALTSAIGSFIAVGKIRY